MNVLLVRKIMVVSIRNLELIQIWSYMERHWERLSIIICGKKGIMENVNKTFISSTFGLKELVSQLVLQL